MTTAVDTSVLIAIDQGEPDAGAWVDCLAAAREAGELVVCDVVAAEFFAVVLNQAAFNETLHDLGVRMVSTSLEASCLAGSTFRRYRDTGGPREHLIPDFLIGAHAKIDCDALAAADRGYFRRYFRNLKILRPRH
jgi:predicted nucleic acid-binding protein